MKQRLPVVAAVISTLYLFSSHAGAAVVVDNFVITETTISFGLSGLLPDTAPANDQDLLYISNPDPSANPGFALGDFINASGQSFTGSQQFRVFVPVATGGITFGDYFYIAFLNPLTPGEAISGTFTASWASNAFDPSQVTSLNIYWGNSDHFSITTGTFLTSVSTVPEVSSVSLLIAGAVVVLPIRRRRK